jgi:hypothetical protein
MHEGWLARTRRSLFALGSGVCFVFFAATAFCQTLDLESSRRIVVVGEVQGAAQSAAKLLQSVELIDDQNHWIGGDVVLIQTGDLIDSGENVRATLDLFMNLQDEAAAAGGRLLVLLGNHEVMNLLGELRDVNYMAYATFAEADSEKRQLETYDDVVAWREERARNAGGEPPVITEEAKAEWLAAHPPGWVEYVESMRPEGVYGQWLRTLPVAIRIGDVVFIHAGISPAMKGLDVEAINQRAADEVAGFDEDRALMVAEGLCLPTSSAREMVGVVKEEIEYINALPANQRTQKNGRVARIVELQDLTEWGSWSVLSDQGPLWFRGTTKWTDNRQQAEMAAILDASKIERMVTGQSDGKDHVIGARFDDRVVLTSIDMTDDPWGGGGEPAALEIVDGVYSVVNLTGRTVLLAKD